MQDRRPEGCIILVILRTRASLCGLLAVALLAAAPAPSVLRPGEPVERPLSAGEAHTFIANLASGTSWLVTVEQLGIDITIEVTGEQKVAVDGPFDRQGTETLLARTAREVTVRAREPGAPPGRYSLHIEEVRDPARASAGAAITRAGTSYLEGTAEARLRALEEYRSAAGLWRALEDRKQEARALYAAAVLARLTGNTRLALELGSEVLPLWQALGERLLEAATRNELGLSLWLFGRMDEARTSFETALAIQRSIGDRYGEAVSLSNLCASDLPRGELRAALACYEEALPRLREVQAAALEGSALTSSGRALDVLGQPDQALLRYREALALMRSIGDRTGEARALNNLAVLHREMGEFQEALASYGQALEIVSDLQDRRWQARVLHNLGAIYQGLGEPRQALAHYEQALPLWKETGDREGEAATLTNLGLVHTALGEPKRALDLYLQARTLQEAAGDRRGEGITHSQSGRALAALGEPLKAVAAFETALVRLRDVGDVQREAEALLGLGEARVDLRQPEEAAASFEKALALARGRSPVHEAQALSSLARVERALGHLDSARTHAAAAIETIEGMRARIGNPDLRSSFAATLHQAYEIQTDLLVDAGLAPAALETGERARARTLLELLGEAGVDLRQGVDPALLERRTSLERRLSARAERDLRKKDETQDQAVLLRELDLVDARIRESSPAHAALIRPQPASAAEVQALLEPDTLLLSYSLGEARSHLFAVTSTTIESFELPPRSVIEEAARRIHGELSAYDPASRAAETREAAALGRMILGPVAERLSAGRRLVIVPDGALHYIPFGSLPGNDLVPLLERHEVVYLPSASALAFQRRMLGSRPPAPKRVAVVADPAFDPRDPTFQHLPASRREAESIGAMAAPGEAHLSLGLQASRAEVLGDKLSGYRTVHFATHGVIDAEHPGQSGLALSTVDEAGRPREGFLHLRDVYDLRLDADLVVLSGCRTALGREVRGEGLIGLTRGFFHAGAPRVVASLWQVEDRATAELMARFYRSMWTDGLTPAAALRAAQLSIRGERRWRDPYFWAGFTLQGDWR